MPFCYCLECKGNAIVTNIQIFLKIKKPAWKRRPVVQTFNPNPCWTGSSLGNLEKQRYKKSQHVETCRRINSKEQTKFI